MAVPLVKTLVSNPGAVLTDLYTVPASRRALIKLVRATNRAGVAKTYRLAVSPLGAAIADAHYLAYDVSLAATVADEFGDFVMAAGDILRIYGADANVSFFISYYEADS